MPHLRTITLFGGTGFVGRHIVRRLAKAGYAVRVPTRNPDKALFLRPMGEVGQIVPVACNVLVASSVAEAVADSDAVINLIGILHEKGRDRFQSVHVETAARIARIAHEAGVPRLIQTSALGANKASSSLYVRSKAMGELAVQAFFPEATLMRPSIIFGPEDHFFNLFASLAKISPVLPLIGGGYTRFQPVYVGDVAEAFCRALDKPESAGVVYELGGPQIYSFRELMEMMLRAIGQKRCLVSVPWRVAMLQAAALELLPHPLLTRDQVRLLKYDNIVADSAARQGRHLGIAPTPLEMILPRYLGRFRA